MMMMTKKKIITLCLMLAGVSQCRAASNVEAYPHRPVRIVSGFQAGGSSDFLVRVLAPKLSEQMGQSLVIENRPGASGAIGANLVAKASADGYTLLFISGAFTAHAAAVKTPYDPIKDFAWLTMIVTYPFVLTVRNDLPTKNVMEFITLAKKSNSKLNYGSVGVGSVFHLSGELFNSMAGIETLHVPYKGSPEALTDMLGGRIDFMFMTLTGAMPHIKSNRIRAIAICSRERSAQMPELPPIAQSVPGYEVTSFAGIGTTAGTPKPIIMRLNREIRTAMGGADVTKQFTEAGGDMRGGSPEQMTQHVTDEIAKWRRVVKERHIEIH